MNEKLRRERRALEFHAESAGVWTADGRPATEAAVIVLSNRGIDISRHRSRLITEEMVRNVALILTMTRSHAEAIRAEFPAYRNKVYLLSEMIGAKFDIEDPVGGTLQQHEMTVQDIENLIERGFPRIMQLVGGQ